MIDYARSLFKFLDETQARNLVQAELRRAVIRPTSSAGYFIGFLRHLELAKKQEAYRAEKGQEGDWMKELLRFHPLFPQDILENFDYFYP